MNNTLVKGLQVLEVLARSESPLGISELSNRLGIGKSNVHRLLQALVEMRYVSKDGDRGSYVASFKIWELAQALLSRMDLRTHAFEAMQELLATTRETVHLSILDGDEVVYVHKLDSPEPVRAYSEIGGRAPAHCVATGKAILAWQPAPRIRSVSQHLVRYSPNTIVSAEQFARELEKVRQLGYAVNRGEWRETVWGIASPIRDQTGEVVAAIGISGPSARIRPVEIKRIAGKVIKAAAEVSKRLTVRA